jgi:uncharacterized lipoprotein YmbA
MKLTFSYIVLVLCSLVAFGCGGNSSPTRYYMLSPTVAGVAAQHDANCVGIGVGPVKVPEYLNRTQIITRSNPNELQLAYFDLWAEPISDAVPRVLAEDISRLLCTREVVLFPWRISHAPDLRVEVEVIKMDGVPGRSADLEAWWSIVGSADKKIRVSKRSTYSELRHGVVRVHLVPCRQNIPFFPYEKGSSRYARGFLPIKGLFAPSPVSLRNRVIDV